MKKQILFLMLALLLMLSVFPAFAEGPDSSAAEILQAQENHLIPHTLIEEDLTRGLTHAELSSLAVRLYSALNPAAHIIPENTHYANVTGHRLQSEMEFAYGLGFLADMGGEYYPDYLVTRQQTAQMLCMVLKSFVYSDWTPERDSRYFLDYNMKFRFADDRDIDSSMADSVYFLAANGIMPGMNDEMFCPGDVISRASAIIAANRLFLTYRNMAPSGDRPSGPTTDVTDPTNGIPGQTTGMPDQTTGLPGQTTGTTDQTTDLPGQTTGMADQTTGMPGQTPDAADQTNGLPGQTTGVIDQITEGGNKKSKVTEQTIEAADPQEEMAALMSRKFSAYYKRFGLVKSDGSLWTWGEKYLGNGETGGSNEPVHIMDDVDAIYMGQEASLAIKTDGTLWAWGNNYGRTIGNGQDGGEQLTPVKILDNVVTASMGWYTAAAVTEDGGLYIWGHNSDGNLADTIPSLGGIGQYLTPTRIMEGVADVSCNNANYGAFTMVLKQDGTLWTFGADQTGQLGDGVTDLSNRFWKNPDGGGFGRQHFAWEPRQILDNVVSIYAGDRMGTAIRADGTVWTWGWNKEGRLANGSAYNAFAEDDKHVPCQTLPMQVADNGAAVREGYGHHTVILKKDGTVWAAGHGYSDVPVQLNISGVSAIAASEFDTYALKSDCSLWRIKGGSYDPQEVTEISRSVNNTCSNPVIPAAQPVVTAEKEDENALTGKKFSAYYKRFGLVKSDGSLWTWGEKYLGNGERGGSNEPVHIMDDVDAVYMGQEASLAIKTDGTLWAWGNNYGRTIGNGQDGGEQLTPVKILDNVVTASMGWYTAAAVTEDGGLYIWGHNSDGNLADTIPSLGGIGQYLTPTRIMEGVADVSCNNANYGAFTMVLKQDGTLWTFGADQTGQLGDGVTDLSNRFWKNPDGGGFGRQHFAWEPRQILDNVVSIYAGDRMGTAIRADGTVWTWGWNKEGRLANGSAYNAFAEDDKHVPCQTFPMQVADNGAAVREGYGHHTVILKKDGTVWAAGHGYSDVPVQLNISGVSAIAASEFDTYALKSDGTLWRFKGNTYDPDQVMDFSH